MANNRQQSAMDIQAVFFDLDGVVIDSEKLHLRALGLTLEKNGISYDQGILDQFVGRSDNAFFRYVYDNLDDRINLDDYLRQKDIHFENLLAELRFVDGFPAFMDIVKNAGLQSALVTSSTAQTVQKVDRLLCFTRLFDLVITADDTTKHKPGPEPYLLALERTRSGNDTTIIIEDSINGIMAGKAAGCIVCGLTTSFDTATLQNAGADFVFDNYGELANRFL